MAHRFFVGSLPQPGERVALPLEEARHAVSVLRLSEGTEVELFDGMGHAVSSKIVRISGSNVQATVIDIIDPAEPKLRVTLYQGLCKGDKMDWIIQKCTELGVHDIQPVLFRRCDVRMPDEPELRATRGQRIAKEAAKQCGRAWIPTVHPAISFDMMIDNLASSINVRRLGGGRQDAAPTVSVGAASCRPPIDNYHLFTFWEQTNVSFAKAINTALSSNMGLVIGPEGGIEPSEIERLEDCGARTVSLGQRILRTETAAITALALTLFASGDLG